MRWTVEDQLLVLWYAMGDPAPCDALTPAEREISVWTMRDWSTARIAEARRTSQRTVANQLRSIYAKLRVSGRIELAILLHTTQEPPAPCGMREWGAFIRGEWILIHSFDHSGCKFMVARKNSLGTPIHPLLTPRERHVLAFRAQALGLKSIAVELGISQGTASRALSSGIKKLGLPSPLDLTRFTTFPVDDDREITRGEETSRAL